MVFIRMFRVESRLDKAQGVGDSGNDFFECSPNGRVDERLLALLSPKKIKKFFAISIESQALI